MTKKQRLTTPEEFDLLTDLLRYDPTPELLAELREGIDPDAIAQAWARLTVEERARVHRLMERQRAIA